MDATGNELLLQQWTYPKTKYNSARLIAEIDRGTVTTFQQAKTLNPNLSFYHEQKIRNRLKQAAQAREDDRARPIMVAIQLQFPALNLRKRNLYHRIGFWWNNKLVRGWSLKNYTSLFCLVIYLYISNNDLKILF